MTVHTVQAEQSSRDPVPLDVPECQIRKPRGLQLRTNARHTISCTRALQADIGAWTDVYTCSALAQADELHRIPYHSSFRNKSAVQLSLQQVSHGAPP